MMNETYEKLVLTKAAFTNLYEYSLSLPTGTTAGKRWKRRYGENWLIGEYLNPENGDIEIKWWEPIVLSETEINQLVTANTSLLETNQELKDKYKKLQTFTEAESDSAKQWMRLNHEKRLQIVNQAKTIDCLREHLKPFVEKLIHERDYGRWGNPTGWCQKCELEDVLDTGEKP